MNELSSPMRDLISSLARHLVQDYLRGEALQDNDPSEGRPTPVPLHDIDQAA